MIKRNSLNEHRTHALEAALFMIGRRKKIIFGRRREGGLQLLQAESPNCLSRPVIGADGEFRKKRFPSESENDLCVVPMMKRDAARAFVLCDFT